MYIVQLHTGYVESQSLAALTISLESNDVLAPAELVSKFIKDFKASLHKSGIPKCCKKYTSRDEKYCGKCGRLLTPAFDGEYFRDKFTDVFGSTINDAADFLNWEALESHGWKLCGNIPTGKHKILSVQQIDGFLAGEYDVISNNYFFSEFRNIEITH